MAEAAQKSNVPKVIKAEEAPHVVAPVAEAKPKRDVMGLVLFFLVCLNLATVGGMGFFMQKMWGKIQELQGETAKLNTPPPVEEDTVGKELQPQNLGILYPIESFLVNINSDQGPKFLQTQLEFELSEPALEDEIARKKPAIRDSIIVLLSSRSYKEMRDPAGMKKLRTDLLKAVNGLLSTGKVKEIYFTQFHFN